MILRAYPNYGYRFEKWSDGNTDNPRTILLTQDTTFTAEFSKNPTIVYSYNGGSGQIYGPDNAIPNSVVTLEVVPDYGYYFTQWSDGNTDNPRTIILVCDTSFTAEFAKNSYTITTEANNPEW